MAFSILSVTSLINLIFISHNLILQNCVVDGLNIAAFNIQVFGQTKMSKPEVVEILVKVVQRYDIILIQEIRDSKQTAIYKFLEEVNNSGDSQYEMKISERMGRTSSKEQYAILYKVTDEILPLGAYKYPDIDDVIHREPFSVHFKLPKTSLGSLVVTGIHTDPDDAPEEIDALADVIDDVGKHFNDDNVLIMGDLNADCSYFNKGDKANSKLVSDKYYWFINDDEDTTTSATNCAYDRFITKSKHVAASIHPNAVKVFRFDLEYGLDMEKTKAVSDHYPIELHIADSHSSAGGTNAYSGLNRLVNNFLKFVGLL